MPEQEICPKFATQNPIVPGATEGLAQDILSGTRPKDLAPPFKGFSLPLQGRPSSLSTSSKPRSSKLRVQGENFEIIGLSQLLHVEPRPKGTPHLPPPYFVMAPNGPTPNIVIQGTTVHFHSIGGACTIHSSENLLSGNTTTESLAPLSQRSHLDPAQFKHDPPLGRPLSPGGLGAYSEEAELKVNSTDLKEAASAVERR